MTTGQKPPRDWQQRATTIVLNRWLSDASYKALVAACPGSGKTQFGCDIAIRLLQATRVELVLVIVPSINVQKQWVEEFEKYGIKATSDANNEALNWRKERGGSMREDKAAIVVTYLQVSRDPELFRELAKRHPALTIGDETHHADDDEAFGKALSLIKDTTVHSLALSGTPFNTAGGALAFCETKPGIDDETGKPIQVTLPTFTYSYGDALNDNKEKVCRRVNFLTVEGSGKAVYRSLLNNELFQRLIKTSRKSDRIGLLFDPNGEFMGNCIREALDALVVMRKAGDKRAAALFVAKSVKHGNMLIEAIERIKQEKPEWAQFANIQEIYNDTPGAHDRIVALENDSTDIIVSVKMISEGVNIKRLRVGVYATNTMTRMFFIQFVGRFIRYEVRDPLDDKQYAIVICPAHPTLMTWMREIELMILASNINLDDGDGGGDGPEKKSELLDVETSADGIGMVFRGEDIENEQGLLDLMYEKSGVFREMPPAEVLKIARDLGFAATANQKPKTAPTNWRKRNENIVKVIVGYSLRNGNGAETESNLYAKINAQANAAAGVPKVDGMTPDDIWQKRLVWLQDKLRRLVSSMGSDLFKEERPTA